MAITIQHKRNSGSGNVPTESDMEQGEIAINLADLRMFTKDHNGAIKRIGGEDVVATLDMTVGQGLIANGTSGTDREFVIEHRSTIKALKSVPSDCGRPGQTRGRMKKRTARRKLPSGNNVRRMRSKLRTGVRTGRTRSGRRFR